MGCLGDPEQLPDYGPILASWLTWRGFFVVVTLLSQFGVIAVLATGGCGC